MPQYPSQTNASGIYSTNQVADLIRGKNFPIAAPAVSPSSVSAAQSVNDLVVSFTTPSINSLGSQVIPNPNPSASDFFGAAMASFGNWLVIGAPEEDFNFTGTGSVYIYYVSDGVCTLRQRIDGIVTNQKFGSSVDIYNDILVVGAPGTSSPVVRGAAYVYQLSETGSTPWVLISTLSDDGWTLYGTSVSTDGMFVAVGSRGSASYDPEYSGPPDGAVWLYKRLDTEIPTWNRVWGIAGGIYTGPNAGQEGAPIGYAVNVRGGHLIYTRAAGSAYLGQAQWFDFSDPYTPSRVQRLKPVSMHDFGTAAGAPYVNALTRFEDIVAFGVIGSTVHPCVGVFKINSSPDFTYSIAFDGVNPVDAATPSYIQLQRFFAPVNNANFGWSVALSKNELVIGAESGDIGGTDTGTVYYYTTRNGENTQTPYSLIHTIQASSVQAGGRFGSSLVFNENGKPNNYLWIGERQRTVNSSSSAGSVWAINPQIQYQVASVPGNIKGTGRASPIKLPLSSFTIGQSYSFFASAWRPDSGAGASVAAASPVTIEFRGETEFTISGTYTWICPPGVTTVAVVAVGSGSTGGGRGPGGGGGALAYRNNISVTPGQSYTIVVAAVNPGGSYAGSSFPGNDTTAFGMIAGRGFGTAGNYAGGTPQGTYTGGGNGGRAASYVEGYWYYNEYGDYVYQEPYWNPSGGGGGAGGYSGNGGNGLTSTAPRTDGAGGGGAGGNGGTPGGGVGLLGQGANGVGNGAGGSGGNSGTAWPTVGTLRFGSGGAGNGNSNDANLLGGRGGVRIIWGTEFGIQRAFPSTGAGRI